MPSFSFPPVQFARISSPVANPNQKNTINRPFFQASPHTGKDQVHFGLKTGLSKIKVTDSSKYIIKMLKTLHVLSNSNDCQKLLLKAIRKGKAEKLGILLSLPSSEGTTFSMSVGDWMTRVLISSYGELAAAFRDNNNEQQCKAIMDTLGFTRSVPNPGKLEAATLVQELLNIDGDVDKANKVIEWISDKHKASGNILLTRADIDQLNINSEERARLFPYNTRN